MILDRETTCNTAAAQCELLSVEKAGEVLGIGRSKMFAMVHAGALPTIRLGRLVRIPRAALLAWIEKRTLNVA
jgi:excisionase family DNA binding protein